MEETVKDKMIECAIKITEILNRELESPFDRIALLDVIKFNIHMDSIDKK